MTNKERKELRNEISQSIDLGKGRFKENELKQLKQVSDRFSGSAEGQTRSQTRRETVKDPRGSWDSTKTVTYQGCRDNGRIAFKKSTYENNDGEEFHSEETLSTGRDIVDAFSTLFRLFFKE